VTKILLVENNEMIREMISRWLVTWSYDVILAVDGEDAIIKAHSDRPDMILMDMGLPKIDGWEATRRLKANDETRQIPIIALTGYALGNDREKALAAGCDEYAGKPVDFERLQGLIEDLL